MAGLSARDLRFADEYLIDLRPVQAAIRAGYSPKTAMDASRWLKEGDSREKPMLRARIETALAERSKRTGVCADRVLLELARIGYAKLPDFANMATGELLANATDDDKAAVASIRVKTIPTADGVGIEREIKLWDKPKALEKMAQHLGMLTDRVIITDDRPTIVDNIPDGGGNG